MAGHRFHPSILRAYDARGIVGETLHEADAYHLGRAFAEVARQQGARRIAVGYDGRHSSPGLAEHLRRGLMDGGLVAVDIGRCPTPQVYFAVHTFKLDGGIMVTGSHNPPSHNGFKLMLGKESFYGEALAALGPLALSGAYESAGRGGEEQLSVQPAYLDALLSGFDANPADAGRAVWDAGNGSAGEVMAQLTARLPGQHQLLYEEIDGDFPNHHPDPSVEANLADVKARVRETGADLGFAFDGDGDRCGLVDDEGETIWADQFMVLLAEQVLAALPGSPIVADVKSSQTLFERIEAMGGQAVMNATGHSLVKARMKALQSPLGGEMSGHIFFGHRWFGFDDGLYTAVRLLSVAAQRDGKLSDFRKSLPVTFATPELRYEVEESRKFGVIEAVAQALAAEGADPVSIDGVRVKEADGWWLLRASNTQAALVGRAEGASQAAVDRMREGIEIRLRKLGIEPILGDH